MVAPSDRLEIGIVLEIDRYLANIRTDRARPRSDRRDTGKIDDGASNNNAAQRFNKISSVHGANTLFVLKPQRRPKTFLKTRQLASSLRTHDLGQFGDRQEVL